MKTFKVGETYETRSACDHDCIFSFEIVRRTAKSVWVDVDNKIVRRSISVWNDTEQFFPVGKYSMAAIISAG
jgi:hypothetical protein